MVVKKRNPVWITALLMTHGFPEHTDKEIRNKTGLANSTVQDFKKAWLMLHDCLFDKENRKWMGGNNKIVEIDEALMGKKHGLLKSGNNNYTMRM